MKVEYAYRPATAKDWVLDGVAFFGMCALIGVIVLGLVALGAK